MLLTAHFFLWIISQFATSSSLQCLPRTSFDVLVDDSTMQSIEMLIDYQESQTKYFCEVMIKFDTSLEILDMSFYIPKLNTSYLLTGSLKTNIVASFELANPRYNTSETSIVIEAKHICANGDRCDAEFIYEYVEQLMKARYDKFIDTIRPLLVFNQTVRFCSMGENFERNICFGYACSWKSNNVNKSLQTQCVTKKTAKLPKLTLITIIERKDGSSSTKVKPYLFLEFICEFNHCNNLTIGETIESAAFLHYPFWADYGDEEMRPKMTTKNIVETVTEINESTTTTITTISSTTATATAPATTTTTTTTKGTMTTSQESQEITRITTPSKSTNHVNASPCLFQTRTMIFLYFLVTSCVFKRNL